MITFAQAPPTSCDSCHSPVGVRGTEPSLSRYTLWIVLGKAEINLCLSTSNTKVRVRLKGRGNLHARLRALAGRLEGPILRGNGAE